MDFGSRQARSIFVGNIPYDATEEKLKEIFGAAGRILSFRIVSERETGKPKGYGFCEYENADIAQSALRNLNNVSFNDRPLRIGPATAGEISGRSQTSLNNSRQTNVVQNPHETNPQQSINTGKINTQNNITAQSSNYTLNAPEQATQQESKIQSKDLPLEIAKKMTTISPELLNQVVQQIKMVSTKDPEQAKAILIHYPHLAYAILHALLLTKSVNSSEALNLLRSMPDAENLKEAEHQAQNPPFSERLNPSNANFNPVYNSNLPNAAVPPYYQQPQSTKTNFQQFGLENTQNASVEPEEEKAQLIRQVMLLTEAQIDMLPTEQQESVRILRNQIMSQRQHSSMD